MDDRTLIKAGTVGDAIAALCCATPLLVLILSAIGLSAWAAKADYVLIPALIAFIALAGLGLSRRRRAQAAPSLRTRNIRHER